jgi:hypothetical protein
MRPKDNIQHMKFLDALREKLQDGISSEIMIAGVKVLQNFRRTTRRL